jgi:hypothetical protein
MPEMTTAQIAWDFLQFSLWKHPFLSFILLACVAYYAFSVAAFAYQMIRR